ncbi:MAG: U32 family peptidase [Candidatus Gastranaerophilales bacterium]|nr:U32 family peptidase [Candidatus Gastranaerophilales bacterium]
MKVPRILSPIKSVDDIDIVAQTGCNSVYIYHSEFLEKSDHDGLMNYVKKINEYNFDFFINFKNTIQEEDILKVNDLLEFLKTCPISGIMINSIDILELIKDKKLPFKIFIDSGLNIHNLAGVEFLNLFNSIDNINVSEEIYIKNLVKIKKYSKYKLSIDSNDLPWIADELIKSKSVEMIAIKGDYENKGQLLEEIKIIEKILENPKDSQSYKLPFKNPVDSLYKSNHFLGEFHSAKGETFRFTGNIQQFSWKMKRFILRHEQSFTDIPRLNLRLTSLEQLKYLKKYIKTLRFNPVYSIEYGEIINTADLSKYSFNKIIEKVKKDCSSLGIKLQLSTPRILIERDFDRVYEYDKLLCLQDPYPSNIIINNIGYWWALINDSDLENLPIELGQGLNLLNSTSILSLATQHNIISIDMSNFADIENMKQCINEIKNKISVRKLTIAGSKRIPSLGLCPLNNEHAILSRLSCAAPCHLGTYAILDPSIQKIFPISVDGFCRMHLFKDNILDLFKYIKFFSEIGINEFSIDFNCLPANLLPVLLNRFLSSLEDKDYIPDQNSINDFYGVEEYINNSFLQV